jgi:hypothetical protein
VSKEYMCPKLAWDLIWGNIDGTISPAAQYSLFAESLPHPLFELNNEAASKTICENPDIFEITCNINIKKFSKLLEDHPNQPFIQSVLVGLHEGF